MTETESVLEKEEGNEAHGMSPEPEKKEFQKEAMVNSIDYIREGGVNNTHTYTHTKSLLLFKLLSHVQLFCDPMDCSLLGSSVHGISQARILEWVAIFFSRGSSRAWD